MIRVYLTHLPSDNDFGKESLRKRASLAAYGLLDFAYTDTVGEPLPPVLRTENGKPYTKKNSHGVCFNLSHTDFYAAVILSDEGECGIDIEGECDAAVAEKIEKRFLSGITLAPSVFDTEPRFFLCDAECKTKRELVPSLQSLESANIADSFPTCSGEIEKGDNGDDRIRQGKAVASSDNYERIFADNACGALLTEIPIGTDRSPMARWTMLEAALKADGRGFGGYKDAEKIFSSVGLRHYELRSQGDLLYISLASVG